MMQRQQGFGLFELVLTLAIISILMVPVVKWSQVMGEKREAKEVAEHVEQVIKQLQEYQYTQQHTNPTASVNTTWPASLATLVTAGGGDYWIDCSVQDTQTGICKRPDWTPWGGVIAYQVNGDTVTLTVPVSAAPVNQQQRLQTELIKMPFTKALSNHNVEVTVKPYLQSIAYEAFVRRDGSTTLTDDWDIGGEHSILNTTNVTIRNEDGSQRSLKTGVVKTERGKHGDRITKPSCPSGLIPDIYLTPISSFAEQEINKSISRTDERAVAIERSGYWQVDYTYFSRIEGSMEWKELNDGILKIDTLCVLP